MLQALAVAVVAFYVLSSPGHAQTAIGGINQKAIVFIKVECEDPDNGALEIGTGSGSSIHKNGFILTAYHVVSCYDREKKKQLRLKSIRGRFGSPFDLEREMGLTKFDALSDLAIIEVLGAPQFYPTHTLCELREPSAGQQFVAAGFPEGSGYQPVLVVYGNTIAGVWQAAADFAGGMSGGPVADRDVIVGVVRGGRKNVSAIRAITPVYLGASMIRDATGISLQVCNFKTVPAADVGPQLPPGSPSVHSSGGLSTPQPCQGRWVVFTDHSVFPPAIDKTCVP